MKKTNKQTNKLPANESPGLGGFTGEFSQIDKELMPIFLKLFQGLKKREHSQNHSMKPSSLWYQD